MPQYGNTNFVKMRNILRYLILCRQGLHRGRRRSRRVTKFWAGNVFRIATAKLLRYNVNRNAAIFLMVPYGYVFLTLFPIE